MKLCLGTVQFGLNYGIAGASKPNLEDAIKTLMLAYKKGIRDYDTACAYGTAEDVVGEFLRRLGDDARNIKITTKSKPNCLNGVDKSQYYEVFESNLFESLKRMNLQQIDCFMIHTADYVFNKEAMESLIKLKATNKVNNVGISVYTPEQAMEALKYDIDNIQLPYNIADNRLDKCGFFKNKKNKKIYCRSAFLQGLLLMDKDKIPEKFKLMKEKMEIIESLCEREKISKVDLCLSYLNTNNNVDYMVFGVDNIDQLEEITNSNFNVEESIIKSVKEIYKDVDEFTLNPSLWNK